MVSNTSKLIGVIAALATLCAFSALSMAAPSYMPPEEVKAGMSGEGLTVFSGSEPASFSFRVLAVTKGESGLSDLIIVRVGGKQVEEIGGIAAGMSGSPCYIEGRLLGALSHVLEGPDPTIGLITPMSQMVKVLEAGKISSIKPAIEVLGWGSFNSAATPIWVSGLGSRALELLSGKLKGAGLSTTALRAVGVGQGISEGSGAFKAGSSIAVQVVNGDIEVGGIGTLTWIEDKSFIAFGHPFMNMGAVSFPMSKSQVLAVLPSDDFAFKLGTFEKPAAVVTQDRAAGIAGLVGQEALMADVQLKVNDMQTGRRKSWAFRCVPDERIVEGLISSAILSAIDGTLLRVGEGSAFITVSVDASGIRILREDMLWSDSDIASAAADEVAGIMGLIIGNDVEEPEISSVTVSIDIAPARLTSVITGIELPEEGLFAGKAATIGIKIRPYRGAEYVKSAEIEIPEGMNPGTVKVSVRASGASEDDDEVYTIVDKIEDRSGLGIGKLKEEIEAAEQNNEIIIEVWYEDATSSQGEDDLPADGEEEPPIYTGSLVLQSVVSGYASEESQIK